MKFSEWMETYTVQNAVGNVRNDRKDLGSDGFEGLQDAVEALKLVARDPKSSSSLNGVFGKLSALVSRQNPDLAAKLATNARKFISAAKHAGTQQPLGQVGNDNVNNIQPASSVRQ